MTSSATDAESALLDITSALSSTWTSDARGAAHGLRPTPAFFTASSASLVTTNHHQQVVDVKPQPPATQSDDVKLTDI